MKTIYGDFSLLISSLVGVGFIVAVIYIAMHFGGLFLESGL